MTQRRFVQHGQRFGRGIVLDPEIKVGQHRGARLLCDCGNEYSARIGNLLREETRSCGCLQRDLTRERAPQLHATNTRHGMASHPLYDSWRKMVARCEEPGHHNYARYGGRGIRVCDRWRDPRAFIADIGQALGPRPKGMTLDRIDNDGNYEPGNVRWATPGRQSRNRRGAKLSDAKAAKVRERYAGGMTQTELAAEYGITQSVIGDVVRGQSWTDSEVPWRPRRNRPATRPLQPCGTKAAYARHIKAREQPCADCRRANAEFSRTYRRRDNVVPLPAYFAPEVAS